jgi:adenylate cyclase
MAPRARRSPIATASESDRAATLSRVRKFLLARGVSAQEIDEAEQKDLLDLLMADRLLIPAERRYTEAEVSAQTGMPVDLARKFWRALGFADPQPDDRIFTDLDVEAIKTIKGLLALGVTNLDNALQLARVIGSSMARIAEANLSPVVVGPPMLAPVGTGDSVEAADLFSRLANHILPAMGGLLEFSWRRHLQAATHRAMLLRRRGTGPLPALCVGFADMVGFTMLSQQLPEDELATVISRFEEVAHFTVTGGGGRLVKMIGDEAMFVSESAVSAARVALGLAEAYADDELLSDVRVGLAEGPVLVQEGDYYGPVVNLAHAVVGLADPGTVLLSDDFHTALLHELHPSGSERNAVEEEFAFRSVRPRTVKDVGRVQLWVLHRPGTKASRAPRRIGQRWERLAEVVSDIEELRDRGERLLTVGLRAAVGSESEQSYSGDAEGAELEGPVHGSDAPASQVDEPT